LRSVVETADDGSVFCRTGDFMDDRVFTVTELKNGFVVAIMIEAKDGEAEAVGKLLQRLVAPTTAEPGVKLFLPYRSPSNPSLFFVFELYVDETGWMQHQETAHFKEAIKDLLPRVSRRERVPFAPFL
jgi:quinol monooxygenase YgiN